MVHVCKKRGLTVVTAFVLVISLLVYPQLALAAFPGQVVMEAEEVPLATGVHYSAYNINADDYKQAIKVLNVNLRDRFTFLETVLSKDSLANDREIPTAMAGRLSGEDKVAVAATNGDFYSTELPYLPIGLQISNGELLISPQGFPALGLDRDNNAFIDIPVMDAYLSVTKELPGPQGQNISQVFSHPIDRVNRERGADMLVLYTPAFATSTGTNDYGTEIVLKGVELPVKAGNTYSGIVAGKIENKGDNIIPRDGLLLSGNGKAQDFLEIINPGDKVELVLKFTDSRWHEVTQAIGGREIILANGKVSLPADTKDKLVIDRHPRTAIGLKQDGQIEIVIADGRQPGYSDGMTLFELAAFMQERGIITALNLDGGGSSVLAARNVGESVLSILNKPAGGQERAVTNGLVIFSNAPNGELSYLYLFPTTVKVYKGSRVQFALRAQDNYYNPAPVPDTVTWRQTGNLGHFTSPGIFHADRAGQGEIIAGEGDLKAVARVAVVDKVDRLEISPATVFLQPGESQQFTITAYEAEGDKILVDNSLYQWVVTEGLGQLEQETGQLKVDNLLANAQVKVKLGDQEAVAAINPMLEILLEGQPVAGQEVSLVVQHNGAPVEGATVRQTQPAATLGEVTASALNVRTGPGTEHKVITLLPRGHVLTVLERLENNWLRVRLADGQEGYVAAEYVMVQEGERNLGQTDTWGRIKFTANLAGSYSFAASKEGYLGGNLEQEFRSR